ncbi:hypothetical protein ACLESO_37000 [Pyxidicoccus sp. 3LG]
MSSSSAVPLSTSRDDAPVCCGPDRVFGIRMPGPGSFQASAPGAMLTLREVCGFEGNWITYGPDRIELSYLSPRNYFLLLSGESDTTLQLSGQLERDATCDLAQPWFTCSPGQHCRQLGDEVRCASNRCGDGFDNDGDGKVDYPAEPGCDSVDDDDETDPATPPACANGVDDDGDGRADYPADPDCRAASNTDELPVCGNGLDDDGDGHADFPADTGCSAEGGGNEAFCGTPASGLIPSALPASVSGNTVGQPNNFTATCGGQARSPDRVYEWVAPVAGYYRLETTQGSYDTVLHVRDLTCGGPQLACDDNAGAGALSRVWVELRASQAVAVIVDGYGTGYSGSYTLGIWKQDEQGLCTGGADEDGDGAIDCEDWDCSADVACQQTQGGGQ